MLSNRSYQLLLEIVIIVVKRKIRKILEEGIRIWVRIVWEVVVIMTMMMIQSKLRI